jgi:7-cyano-7-deazaguanine synthase in queuosine biosynthesis
MKAEYLRKKYPRFVYQNYSFERSKKDLKIFFDFKIEPDIFFQPTLTIKNIPKNKDLNCFENLIFHLGLIEMISYWKATCSPEIEIKAGFLNKEQINWWKELIFKGMGQFFYENKIDFRKPNFLKIKILHSNAIASKHRIKIFLDQNRILVPVGGGKDSVVTLEILKKAGKDIQCFSLNPTKATLKILRISGCKNPIIVRRKIDEKLLDLNRRGFLNGHTPFSAYLAFLSVLVAVIFGQKYIAFSNERSSNEGNVKYFSKTINHQWSKSFEFEQKFRKYSKKYLTSKVEYFSFLRPLYEIQIAKLFSKYHQYFSAFLSCNVAYQTDSGTKRPIKKWCGFCPKCLFVFAALYPFVNEKKLVRIFGQNLFDKKNLLSVFEELIGEKKFKPFECVGTKKENLISFYLDLKKERKRSSFHLPILLRYFNEKILPKYKNLEKETKKILNSWNNRHYLKKEFEKILKKSLDLDKNF